MQGWRLVLGGVGAMQPDQWQPRNSTTGKYVVLPHDEKLTSRPASSGGPLRCC